MLLATVLPSDTDGAACVWVPCAQAWKPFPSSYGYAVKRLGVAADKVVMVASHPWDIAGAMQVGTHALRLLRTRGQTVHLCETPPQLRCRRHWRVQLQA